MGSLKRRDFIKTAAVAGAGIALTPSIISASRKVRWQRDEDSRAQRVG